MEGRFSTVSKFLRGINTMFIASLLCTPAFAIGPPGPAHNGGTGNGIDNFYAQIPDKTMEEQNKVNVHISIQAAAQTRASKKNDYPKYVNVNKTSKRFVSIKP